MKTLLLSALCLFLLISCDSDDPNQVNSIDCFPFDNLTMWKYDINGNSFYESLTANFSDTVNNEIVTIYKIERTNDIEESYSWYYYNQNDNIWFYSDNYMYPFILDNFGANLKVRLRFSLCNKSDFSYKDSIAEKISIIINGKPENREFYHIWELTGNYVSSMPVSSTYLNVNCDLFNCEIRYYEHINWSDIPEDQRIRNEQIKEFSLWYSKEVGFVKIISSGDTTTLESAGKIELE